MSHSILQKYSTTPGALSQIFALHLFGALAVACGGEDPAGTPSGISQSSGGSVPVPQVDDVQSAVDACPSIGNNYDYKAIVGPGCVSIGQLTVTDLKILPGTTIKIERDGYLRIEGLLTALGTETEKIVFESADPEPLPGDWGCLYFDGDPDSDFEHVEIKHGGAACKASGIGHTTSMILLSSPRTLSHVSVEKSASHGLQIDKEAYNIRSLSNVSFSEIAGYSLVVEPEAVGALGTPLSLDSDDRFIEVDASGIIDIGQPTTWSNLGIPYGVTGELNLHEPLTIEPGTSIFMADSLRASLNAHVIAEGTAAQPITWTSREPVPSAGDWGCLYFSETYVPSRLSHNIIEYAGGACGAGLAINRTTAQLDALTFSNIQGVGVRHQSCESVDLAWCSFHVENAESTVSCSTGAPVSCP